MFLGSNYDDKDWHNLATITPSCSQMRGGGVLSTVKYHSLNRTNLYNIYTYSHLCQELTAAGVHGR